MMKLLAGNIVKLCNNGVKLFNVNKTDITKVSKVTLASTCKCVNGKETRKILEW